MAQVPLAAGMASSSSGCRWQGGGALVGGGPGEKGAWAERLGRVGQGLIPDDVINNRKTAPPGFSLF